MAARFLAGKAEWLKPLQQMSHTKETTPSNGLQEQDRVFEQYTNVLRALASEQPLILILDDLQWADAASTALLFHLGRHIGESRILVVGAYRPEEVGGGRGDERHPLEKVLNEFKHYFGDVAIDLRDTQLTEGQDFVNAFLDAEPNHLGKLFREALFERTGGHALFTVELLRSLRERGDMQRDNAGAWVAKSTIDWALSPARVEAVIEERVGRLEDELRETLRIASIEGESFTAEVVARLQELRERQVLRILSEELDKRHRLVREQGQVRIGQKTVSRYRFVHALFQRYLYEGISPGERQLLHGEIARVLEELYAGRQGDITVQLAWHYSESGEDEKAFGYLVAAGNQARRMYANQEAVRHFRHAQELFERSPGSLSSKCAVQLYEELGDIQELTGQCDQARQSYQRALELAPSEERVNHARIHRKIGRSWMAQRHWEQAVATYDYAASILGQIPDDMNQAWLYGWLELELARGWTLYMGNRVQEMINLAEKVRPVVEEHATPTQRAVFFRNLVLMRLRRDRYCVSEETFTYAQKAAQASRASADKTEIAFSDCVLAENLVLGRIQVPRC